MSLVSGKVIEIPEWLIVLTAEQIIELFGMKPLAGEGGFYVETYRCGDKIGEAHLPAGYAGQRSFSSAILYLLTPDTKY